MSRLDEAQRRLEQAMGRLERAAQSSRARLSERNTLARSLEAARAESRSLREVSSALSTRLDSVIGRLRSIIET
jgi:hypothetical protein